MFAARIYEFVRCAKIKRADKGCEKINGFKVIHFRRIIHFSMPCKHQETSGFLMFLRGIEKEPWPEMG